MRFKEDWQICSAMPARHCPDCGHFGKQPCDVKIPDHILSSQVPMFVRLAREKKS